MAPDAMPIHPEREDVKNNIAYHAEFVRGEGEDAFKYADVIVEDHFATQIQHQGYLEQQGCVAEWDASGKLTLTGRIQATPRAFGLIVYNDQERIEADYDAVGYTCKLTREGDFRLEIDEFHPGRYEMRWRVCHRDGRTTPFDLKYDVDDTGHPDLKPLAALTP